MNEYYIRIRENVGAELKKQMKMNVFYWMMNKTVLIPEYGLVNGGYGSKHEKGICVLIILSVAIIYLRNLI